MLSVYDGRDICMQLHPCRAKLIHLGAFGSDVVCGD